MCCARLGMLESVGRRGQCPVGMGCGFLSVPAAQKEISGGRGDALESLIDRGPRVWQASGMKSQEEIGGKLTIC